ncbi:MAG: pirin family protein [Deltaproteobacteria bacterium]|nr:pirin family protein [Deltaproteobacteria bacterium]MBW1894349.1 pirin family protein [Deltaproteobacteria bacterium]
MVKVFKSMPTVEGAGVNLKRVFGFSELPTFDPFLLMDDFRSDNPDHYIKGFPWHPHRGIETITYVLQGDVEHGDSMGNKGTISNGDVQWMTAGSGIIHQEMPKGDAKGIMGGFQLWANLPASHKMMPPRYQEIKSDQIPEVVLINGTKIKVICGIVEGIKGPVQDIVIEPEYLDVSVPENSEFIHQTKESHTVFAYIIKGKGEFGKTKDSHASEKESTLGNETLVLFDNARNINVTTKGTAVRFLLISGKPIGESVAWQGPIVMNTQEELKVAFEEYESGRFIKN